MRHAAAFFKYLILNAFFRVYILVTPYRFYKQSLVPIKGGPARIHLARWVGHMTARSARFVPSATCLSRALTARWVLARKGYGCTLRVGVAKDGNKILAHAWLMSGDQVVTGNENGELNRYNLMVEMKAEDQ